METKSLQNIAYQHLREMIYSRELEFDMIYSETRLASQLSISRTPVRDALNRLSRERYIDILPNRGFTLHKPDADDIREAYHVRRMIELYCGTQLARDMQTEDAQAAVDWMQECLDNQIAMVQNDSVVQRDFWLQDQEFHFAPLRHLNISAFNMQYDTFLHIFMPHNIKDDYVVGRYHSTVAEHREIVAGLREGSVDKTVKAIEAHLDSTLRLARITLEERDLPR